MKDELVIFWASKDKKLGKKTVIKYIKESIEHKWWGGISLIMWGPSIELLLEEETIRAELLALNNKYMSIEISKEYTDEAGLTDEIKGLGLTVRPCGEAVTLCLRTGIRMITF